jgi:hypothetical protein
MRSDRLAEPGTIWCLAERVGFEPTCPLLAGKTLSRRPRYDHFGTSPAIDSLSDRIRDSLRYRAIRSSMDRNIIHSSCTALMEQWFNGSITPSSFPSAAKKLAQYHGAIRCHHSPHNSDPVIELGVIEHMQGRTARARLAIARSEDHPSQPRLHDGSGAHRTRFDCNIQSAVVQAVVPQLLSGPAKSEEFGVSSGIVEMDGPIVRARHQAAVLRQNRSHGNFTFVQSALSLAQGQRHKLHELGSVQPGSRHAAILSCPRELYDEFLLMLYCKLRHRVRVSYLAVGAQLFLRSGPHRSSTCLGAPVVARHPAQLKLRTSHDLPAILSWLLGARILLDWR